MTIDHNEALLELSSSEQWQAVTALMEATCEALGEQVMKYDVNLGEQGLLILKARYDGARALVNSVETYAEALRKQEKEDGRRQRMGEVGQKRLSRNSSQARR